MFLVGLTGGIATVVEPGKPAWRNIVKSFGEDILLPTGEINRNMLGDVVFSDPQKRRLLNSCTHPAIRKAILWKILKMFLEGRRFAVLEVPLLFESGVFAPFMNKIIVAYCDQDTQLRRLMERNDYTREQAEQRMASQMPLDEKCQLATHVVDNSGTTAETFLQVEAIHKELNSSWAFLPLRIAFAIVLGGIGFLCYWVIQKIL
ncbi:dephospho-CoA kinase domain-containing protein-like isoform X2 [Dendronephthya gigantea]|uniref:dephospho-CoA kinase domain-containing protein-like isoform X2 n=1 Tax=Dendronephthya gigantea TaxID=151771 RepID=UPI00106AC402|nr:dephospho-CoA kinase domain-containing protein-like isoform X2 [Dendronephthya gigantea]